MSRQLPYYKMYPADAETDENFRSMTFEERGFYWTALNHSWLNDGLPPDDESLMKLFGIRGRKQFNSIEFVLRSCFESDGKRLRNPRQEAERAAAITKSERATKSIRMRYERSSNDALRAYESVSESSEDLKEKKDGEILRPEFDDQWQDFQRLYLDTGKPLIPEDFTKAHFIWRVLDFAQRTEALAKLAERKLLHDPQFIPKPERFLQGGEYARAVVARTSNGNSRHDQIRRAMEEA